MQFTRSTAKDGTDTFYIFGLKNQKTNRHLLGRSKTNIERSFFYEEAILGPESAQTKEKQGARPGSAIGNLGALGSPLMRRRPWIGHF